MAAPAEDPVLALESRRRVYAHVLDRPGAYLREIQRALAMPMGMLEHHLGRLEEAGLLTVVHEDHKRYFPGRMDARDKRVLAVLRQAACARLAAHLLARPGASHKELQAATGLLPSTLSYYLSRMVSAGLASREKDGRSVRYTVVDAARVHAVLVQHRPSFLDRVLDRILESIDDVRPRGGT